jgi:hypothetical protein
MFIFGELILFAILGVIIAMHFEAEISINK